MSSSRTQKPGFPAVPPSLAAGDHEMRDYSLDSSYDAPPPTTAPHYTPYLGLRARLSQIWINRWTILLVLVLCRVLLAVQGLNNDIDNAKTEALSACSSVENIGSAMASLPHYMSQGVNQMAADGVTKAVNGLMDMLMLTITGVEELILFVINMLTSTYVCLITLAVAGSLHVAIDVVENVGDFMNKTIGGLTSTISSDIESFESSFNSFLSDLESIPSFLGVSSKPPTISNTLNVSLAGLNDIHIDTSAMDENLDKLNASIPTFADVQNFTNTVIRLPFEEIKKLINESTAGYTFDKSVFPVAQKESLTFCSDNNGISDFFAHLTNLANTARKVFIVVITILAILACFPMAWLEIRRWRTMQSRALLLQKHAFDPMDVVYIASRPYTAGAGIATAARFKSTKRQILTRWFIAYATSIPALFVLALGIAGLFSCLCQYILLRGVEKEVPVLANQVENFADTVVNALNNASEQWAISANGVINSTNTKINDDVFGWVNTSTTAVNDTLNTFVDQMTIALNDTFGGTILYDPITEVFNCLIGLKVASVEKGLTWVHDNAHVTFPEFRNDTFSLGAAASIANDSSTDSFLASPGSAASDDITSAVVKMTNLFEQAIRQEAIIAGCIIGVWAFIMLIGLFRVLAAWYSRDKTRAEGGPVGFGVTGNGSDPIGPRSPLRGGETRFPEFGGPVSAVGPMRSQDDTWGAEEKLGHAGHRSLDVDDFKMGSERRSSYGVLAGEKR
jgi:hypothetical protein